MKKDIDRYINRYTDYIKVGDIYIFRFMSNNWDDGGRIVIYYPSGYKISGDIVRDRSNNISYFITRRKINKNIRTAIRDNFGYE